MKKPYQVMTGISRGGAPFEIKTRPADFVDLVIKPGTYTAAYFAEKYPEYYSALIVAGMPHAVHSLITITGK